MPAHSKYGERDSSPEGEVHAQWNGGVNSVLPADRLPALNFTHALNMELRAGYPETRRSVERAHWLYRGGSAKLGTTFQGYGLVQGTQPDRVSRAPSALLVVADDALWLCAPNNEPTLLREAITDQTQPVEILDYAGEHLILRGIAQPPLRYKYAPGRVPRELPLPRAIGGFAQLPAADTGCSAGNRVWLKKGKNHVVASDAYEWDYDPALQDFLVDDGENDEIVRLWPYGENRIVVFKTRSVHVIDGVSGMDTVADPPVLPGIYRVAAARGCVAPYTICQRGSAVLYLSREGVEVLDLSASAVTSQAAMPLSKAADRYFQEVKWTGIAGARATIADNYYLLSVPTRFGDMRLYPYPMVIAPWDVGEDPPTDWVPTTVGEPPPAQCSLTDPQTTAPEPLSGTPLETWARADHYGQLGFEASYLAGPSTRPWWDQCSYICWCDGPEVEAVPLVTEYERFSVRWRGMVSGGSFYYAREGEGWRAAPAGLFPTPLPGASEVSLAFDANARPCFATVVAGQIQIRRFVAGVPTTYAFPGSSPRLFFNGLLQRESSQRDVVCLYLRGRKLCQRMQRDNFAAEYVLANPELPDGPYSLARLGATDAVGDYQVLAATTTSGTPLLLRSGLYPPWPVVVIDYGAAPAYGVEALEYERIIVELGTYTEPGIAPAYGMESIEYDLVVVAISGGTEAGAAPAYAMESLEYDLVVVSAGSYSEAGAAPAYGMESLEYELVSVSAGTYSEAGAAPAYGMESIEYV